MFVFVALLAAFFLKEQLWKNKRVLLSALLLLAGNFLLLQAGKFEWNYGTMLVLGATVLWAGENVLSKHVLKELDGNVVAFGRMFFGALFILVYLAFSGEIMLLQTVTFAQAQWIAVTSVLLCGYVITWYNGLKSVSVTVATSVLLLGSPITTFLNYAFAGASISAFEVAGVILFVTGAALMVFFTSKEHQTITSTA